jgi:hypothetical protein
VNHAFKAITVDTAGTHHVIFRYRPKHFVLALWIAALGAAGGLAGFFLLLRRSHNDSSKTIAQAPSPLPSA